VHRYVETFDEVVAGILPHVGQPVIGLSGGLDSTFVAASVARAAPGSAVTALHSAPLPISDLGAGGNRDPDETHLAQLMAQASSDNMNFKAVVNEQLVRPLDEAAEYQARAGVPAWASANLIWMTEFDRTAKEVGAAAWFTGWHGNASFSSSHEYAEEYYLRRGRISTALALRPGSARSMPRRLGGIAKAATRAQRDPQTAVLDPLPGVPPRCVPASPLSGRDRWLRWLAFRGRGLAAARNPAAGRGIVSVDPFAAPSLLAVAAAIEPAEWRRGGMSRAFARRAGEGRVPDEIRLRTRRGLQSADMWFVIRNDRDAYLDRIVGISGLPGLQDIDERALLQHVAQWPWGEMPGPPRDQYTTLDRILATAQFIRDFSEVRRGEYLSD
jgi:hypothetical protein